MAEMTITVKIEDLPEFKAGLARIKKIMRRRAWETVIEPGKRGKAHGKERDTIKRNCGAGFFGIPGQDI